MSEENTVIENTKPENRDIKDFAIVPDSFFIFKSFEISEKTSTKKLLAIVFNQIVENSPFPIEQLLWGFVQSKHRKNSLIWYAGLKEKVQSFLGEIPTDKHVIPCGALAILLGNDKGNCWLSVENQTSVVMEGEPKAFLSEKCDNWETIKLNFGHIKGDQPKHYVLKQVRLNHANDYKCILETSSEDGQSFIKNTRILSSRAIWSADIRDKESLKLLKRQKEILAVTNRGLKWVGYMLLATLVFQLGLLFGKSVVSWKKRVVKRQTSLVKKIENKDFLVRQMQAMLEQEMRPFELLGLLNSHRPNDIYFSNATIDNAHNIVVEAVAESAMSVQEYADKLEESGMFESVRLDNINVSHQGTKFKLSCDFKEKQGSYFSNLK